MGALRSSLCACLRQSKRLASELVNHKGEKRERVRLMRDRRRQTHAYPHTESVWARKGRRGRVSGIPVRCVRIRLCFWSWPSVIKERKALCDETIEKRRTLQRNLDFISAVDPCQPGLIHRVTLLYRDLQRAAYLMKINATHGTYYITLRITCPAYLILTNPLLLVWILPNLKSWFATSLFW